MFDLQRHLIQIVNVAFNSFLTKLLHDFQMN